MNSARGWQLRSLATAGLAGTLVALVLVTIAGIAGWQRAQRALGESNRVAALHADMERLRLAVAYMTTLDADPAVARGIAGDADRIGRVLAAYDDPEARLATAHLREIGLLAAGIAEGRLPPAAAPDAGAAGLTNIARELRTHINLVANRLYELSANRQQQAFATLRALLLGLLAVLLALALLSLLAFTVIHRRLVGPLRAIEVGLDDFGAGRLAARIELRRNDELGRLARTFNHMAEQRQQQESRLSDSEQRLRLFAAATTGCVFDVNLVQRTVWWDERFQQLTGYAPGSPESTFDGWLALAHPEDRRRVLDGLVAAHNGADRYWESRHRFRHADGH